MAAIIEVRDLVKTFGGFAAVDRISFSVAAGRTFAFLGPIGAGKTTTIKMLTMVLKPTAGSIRVRRSFGIVFQDPSLETSGLPDEPEALHRFPCAVWATGCSRSMPLSCALTPPSQSRSRLAALAFIRRAPTAR